MSVDVPLNDIRIKQLPTINLGGGVDFDLDEIRIRELAPISIGVTELPDINFNASLSVDSLPTIQAVTDSAVRTDSTVKTDNKVDLALDVRVRELPRFDIQLGLRPMRFHFPLSYRFCLKLFGFRVFEFETCGEGMVIAEDYVPRKQEECDHES